MKLSVIKACSYLNLAHQLPLNKACSRQDIYPVLSWCTPAVLAKMKACCQVWGRVWNHGSAAFTVEYQLCPHPAAQRTSSARLLMAAALFKGKAHFAHFSVCHRKWAITIQKHTSQTITLLAHQRGYQKTPTCFYRETHTTAHWKSPDITVLLLSHMSTFHSLI